MALDRTREGKRRMGADSGKAGEKESETRDLDCGRAHPMGSPPRGR